MKFNNNKDANEWEKQEVLLLHISKNLLIYAIRVISKAQNEKDDDIFTVTEYNKTQVYKHQCFFLL